MDAKLRYKAKKIKIIFFDIDDTLRKFKRQVLFQVLFQRFLNNYAKKEFWQELRLVEVFFGVVPEIKALKPDFFVTLNGAYIEDKKGNVIYSNKIAKDKVEEYITWTKEVGIDYGWWEVMLLNYQGEQRWLARRLTRFILI